jgi:hypothetical protein
MSRGGSRVGNDLVEGFEEIAGHLRGEIELEAQELHLLRSPTNAKRLRASIRKADAGKLIERDINCTGCRDEAPLAPRQR